MPAFPIRLNFIIAILLSVVLLGPAFADQKHAKPVKTAKQGKTAKAAKTIAPAATTMPPPPPLPGVPLHMSFVAGSGQSGAQEGAGKLARFADPYGVAVDKAGNVFVADGGENNRIRKITPAGVVSTFAGGAEGFADGRAEGAHLNTPSGLAIDAAGNLYVADTGNNAIRKITPQGMVSTLAGDGVAGFRDGPGKTARFNGPLGVAVDAAGNVWVADSYNDRIRMISPKGEVTTIAGGAEPGFQDGAGHDARFDTPVALTFTSSGQLWVADMRNHAIRRIDAKGQVSTVLKTGKKDYDAWLRRPQGLVADTDGGVWISEASHGRILHLGPEGTLHGVSGVDVDCAKGEDCLTRLSHPVALARDAAGNVVIADASLRQIRKLSRQSAPAAAQADWPARVSTTPPSCVSHAWPLAPQQAAHEIIGTLGEVRGNPRDHYRSAIDERDHFHAGLDIQAVPGTPVLAMCDAKVAGVLPSWGTGELHEALSLDELSYIHMRVGRDAHDAPLDPGRFQLLKDEHGKFTRVRIKRGTRFRQGEPLGSVNGMAHVHLEYHPDGHSYNPLLLPFAHLRDTLAPHIEAISLIDAKGKTLAARRGERLRIARKTGRLDIVVEAWDQIDGDAAKRQLGLYQLGYQILGSDGKPLPGFAEPHMNLVFDRLPEDDEMVNLAYAPGSSAKVLGKQQTRFRYVVSNLVRAGSARVGGWDVSTLAPGAYIIRISALDFAGNVASKGRDLPVLVE